MAPKSRKAIDEPPANSTRAKTATDDAKGKGSDSKTKSGRKHAADFFDGEIADNAEKVVPRAKVPKAKTAKQTAEVDADTKPSKIDDPLPESPRSHSKDHSKEDEPTKHARPKKGRVTKDETAKPDDAGASPARAKPKKVPATKGEAAKVVDTNKTTKSTKSEKGKAPKSAAGRSTNADAQSIETEKAHPGDDRVEAEPSEPVKGKKSKTTKAAANKSTNDDGHTVETEKTHPGGDRVEVEPTEPVKGKKAKATKGAANKSTHVDGHTVETEKTHPGGDRVEVEPTKSVPGEKGKAKGGETAAEPAPSSVKAGRKSKGSKDTKKNDDTSTARDDAGNHSNAEPAKPKKRATKSKSEPAEQAASTEPQKKGRKPKPPSKNAKIDNDSTEIAPDMAMDDSNFDSLLGTDKGRQSVDEAPAEKSKPPKTSRKQPKEQDQEPAAAQANAKPGKKAKDASKVTDDAEPSTSKARKRKAPAGNDAEAVKTDVLDPLSDMASAKKKQKKSQPSALEAVGSLVGSTVDSAKKKAKAIMGYADELTGSAQKSIMKDVTGVAEGAVEEKKKNKRSKARDEESKKDKDHQNEDEVDDDDASFFGDTEFLKGFESSGDERDGPDVDFPSDKSVPTLDKDKQAQAKAAIAASSTADSTTSPGYIYVGRIPHGFYEKQMRAYFQQFGHITNLRLSRNKTTGRSKHFAFLEFASEDVAKIVAQTMDNYLLFGHILKVKLIPKEQLHPETFKGANKPFKTVPWARIQARELAMPVEREVWEKRVVAEQEKREKKARKVREEIGYEFEAGTLKGVDSVPVRKGKGKQGFEDAPAVVQEEEEEQTLITQEKEGGSSLVVTEVTKVKKVKGKGKEVEGEIKKGKRKAEEEEEEEEGLEKKEGEHTGADVVAGPVAKKVKKSKDKAAKTGAEAGKAVAEKAVPAARELKKTVEKATKGKK